MPSKPVKYPDVKKWRAEGEKIIDGVKHQGFRFPEKKREFPEYPGPFALDLPEIYQIEVTNLCNYNCIMCPKDKYERKDVQPFIDPKIIHDMIHRKEFAGSYFVELQLSGEPLMHPQIHHIINIIKSTGVMVGLSTNGSMLGQVGKLEACKALDYITISIDSITNLPGIRPGSPPFEEWWEKTLSKAVPALLDAGVVIDFQFIELPHYTGELYELGEMAEKHPLLKQVLKEVTVRTVPDCSMFVAEDYKNEKGVCLNPWLSVTIQCNGNVVPCCFAWGDDIVYGNIKNNTLKEIWEGEAVKELRSDHERGWYRPLCNRCYMRSPALLHMEIFFKSIKRRKNDGPGKGVPSSSSPSG